MTAPATLALSRVVRPGRVEEFRAWADRVDAAVAAAPGHAGGVRLEQASGLYHLLHRFDDAAALARWTASAEHQALIAAGEASSVGLQQDEAGTQVRFALPSEAAARKWKSFLVTWLAVLPVLLTLSTASRQLLPGLPPLLQTGVSSMCLTALLTWVVMPRVSRWSRFWQLQGADGRVLAKGDAD